MLSALLDALDAIAVELPDEVPNEILARERLQAGIPALTGEPLLEGAALRAAVGTLLRALAERPAGRGQIGRGLTRAIARKADVLDWDALAEIALAARWDALPSFAIGRESDVHPLATVLDWSARPTLRAAAARLANVLREERWERGRCPACGELPILGELRSTDAENARTMRCARCASAWSFVRLACPSCGTRDHRRLTYLSSDGNTETQRIACCDNCQFYVKEVATLEAFSPNELLRVDLSTAGFDILATERGYNRGAI
jgi:formate dehydrogenase accessory protein FdhE